MTDDYATAANEFAAARAEGDINAAVAALFTMSETSAQDPTYRTRVSAWFYDTDADYGAAAMRKLGLPEPYDSYPFDEGVVLFWFIANEAIDQTIRTIVNSGLNVRSVLADRPGYNGYLTEWSRDGEGVPASGGWNPATGYLDNPC